MSLVILSSFIINSMCNALVNETYNSFLSNKLSLYLSSLGFNSIVQSNSNPFVKYDGIIKKSSSHLSFFSVTIPNLYLLFFCNIL